MTHTLSDQPALEIENVSKYFQNFAAVKNLSLSVYPGEIFGLLGPNGAGKSTLINLISGVCCMQKGTISVFGYDNQAQYTITRRLTGVMHQEVVFDPFLTVDQALKIHSGYYGVPDDPHWRNILIDELALRPHLKKRMSRLSGGMKRRFMVAKALIHKPKLLILDEPTAGVDVELRKALWKFVRQINEEGTTIILTTHYLEEAEEMCGRIAIMDQGSVVALDEKHRLLNNVQKKEVEICLKQPIEEIPVSLKAFHPQLSNSKRMMWVQLHNQSQTESFFECLHHSSLQIEDMETRSARLEDVFFSLTAPQSSQKGASPS